MPLTTDEKLLTLSHDVIEGFDKADGGIHPGFRPAHAKGILLTGVFTPSLEAASLTRAPHIQRNSTPVTVRFSDFAGIPTVPDNDPQGASPRGCTIRFHLYLVDTFPSRTAEGFLDFINALIATDPAGPHPNAIEQFLGAHPAAGTVDTLWPFQSVLTLDLKTYLKPGCALLYCVTVKRDLDAVELSRSSSSIQHFRPAYALSTQEG